jgi:hypothetical protein
VVATPSGKVSARVSDKTRNTGKKQRRRGGRGLRCTRQGQQTNESARTRADLRKKRLDEKGFGDFLRCDSPGKRSEIAGEEQGVGKREEEQEAADLGNKGR